MRWSREIDARKRVSNNHAVTNIDNGFDDASDRFDAILVMAQLRLHLGRVCTLRLFQYSVVLCLQICTMPRVMVDTPATERGLVERTQESSDSASPDVLRLELERTKEAFRQRGSPWWLVLAAGIGSSMLPVATLIHGMYQARVEESRRERELGLAERTQLISQDRAWLEIAVDAQRPEAQRQQVLRFLAKGEGRVAQWAREESNDLAKVIKALESDLANERAALQAARKAESCPTEKTHALENAVQILKVRLGQSSTSDPNREAAPAVDNYEQGACNCGASIWPGTTYEACNRKCKASGFWQGEMTGRVPVPRMEASRHK
jgi:hypothetical protein